VVLKVTAPSVVRGKTAVVAISSDATKITVDGKRVKAGKVTVRLARLGSNELTVTASEAGRLTATKSVMITRKETAAEVAARRAAAKRAAAATRQRYENRATTIPYNQLLKNPDRYAGKVVTYRGQIMQIQEDSAGGGVMLINVTNEGYGFWTDLVWVDYASHVKSAADDIVTIYGPVVGGKSYDTQIGGSNYVPEILAVYVIE
jgi:hypothetical protein